MCVAKQESILHHQLSWHSKSVEVELIKEPA